MQYSQKGCKWYSKFITRINFIYLDSDILRNLFQVILPSSLATSVKKTEEQTDTVIIKLKEVRVNLYDRTGQCRHDGNLFCFFLPTHKKEEGNPTNIAAHWQAPRAESQNQSLQKSCNIALAPVLIC
jgi:hypothetical protein